MPNTRRQNIDVAPDGRIDRSVLSFHDRRLKAELNLLGSILADHPRLLRTAADAGIRRHHFANDDLRIIFLAIALVHRQDLTNAFILARVGLRGAGFWDETQIAGNLGLRWSDAALAALSNSWFPSAAIVKHFAEKLLELHHRDVEIRNTYNRLIALIDSDGLSNSELGVAA